VAKRAGVETEDRIERVYREQGGRLYHALLGYSGDREIARDAVAEAFARALSSGDAVKNVEPWVWRVAFRVAAGEMKRGRRSSPLARPEQPAPQPSELFEALRQLSPRQRAAVILHYYAGYSLDEIAGILGTRKGTIGVHLHRGRARLKGLLEVHDG
jgi:RNA polymerase sigma-70 factor (ECF subfamily)